MEKAERLLTFIAHTILNLGQFRDCGRANEDIWMMNGFDDALSSDGTMYAVSLASPLPIIYVNSHPTFTTGFPLAFAFNL